MGDVPCGALRKSGPHRHVLLPSPFSRFSRYLSLLPSPAFQGTSPFSRFFIGLLPSRTPASVPPPHHHSAAASLAPCQPGPAARAPRGRRGGAAPPRARRDRRGGRSAPPRPSPPGVPRRPSPPP